MKKVIHCFFIVIILCIGCATVPPQGPQNENSSIIGISIKINSLIFSSYPTTIYFIKLNEKDNTYQTNNLILQSNYQKDDQFYFLNVEPGRYIAIAGFKKSVSQSGQGSSTRQTTNYSTYYFPIDIVQLTDVKFQLGDIVFMGKYIVDLPFNLKYGIINPDELQLFYCKRLQPNKVDPTVGACLLEALSAVWGTNENAEAVKLKEKNKDVKTEIEFWRKAKKHFEGDNLQKSQYKEQLEKNQIWLKIIDRKLNKLGTK